MARSRWLRAIDLTAAMLAAVTCAVGWPGGDQPASTTLTEDFELHGDGGGGGPGAPGDRLGWSVAVDGDTAVVGAPGSDLYGSGVGVVYVFVRSGGIWVKQQKLSPADPELTWLFGRSVALSGDTIVVGVADDRQLGSGAGAAYVFVRDGTNWTQQQKLLASDGAVGDWFGWCVAVSGDVALVGAVRDDDAGESSGSAYVFERNGGAWTQRQKLTAADAAEQDQFGGAVAIFGDTALVGSRLDDDAGEGSGSAYVFVDDAGVWVQQQKLTASDSAEWAQLGWSVALSGDTAVVGALSGQVTVADSGSVYVFVRSGGVWSQQAELEASDAETGDGFGQSLALVGDRAAVGSWRAFNDNPGATYVFDRSGGAWGEQAKLVVGGSIPEDKFGTAVSLSGDTVLVGAPSESAAGAYAGAAYVFAVSGGSWAMDQELLGDPTAAFDYFGFSLAVSGDTLLVGAPHDGDGFEPGSVYLFERSGPRWALAQKLSPDDAGANDWFGQAVAVRDGVATVGAPYDVEGGVQGGAAYVFGESGGLWTERQKLVASDAQSGSGFGAFVALSADTVLVGSEEPDGSGAVYVFTTSGGVWAEQQKLRAPHAAGNDLFGGAFAIEGETLLVGTPWDDESAIDAGAVYVFERHGGTWIEVQKLMASDAAEGDQLGWPALSGETALVGAAGADGWAGTVYAFEREGGVWIERGRLTPEDPEPDSHFGTVSSAGDLAVIGAYRGFCGGVRSGAAYLFQRSGGEWRQLNKLCPSDPIDLLLFGFPLALTRGEAFVGAPFDDDDGWRSGSVYRFSVPLFTDGFESGNTGAWSGVIP